MFTLRLSSATCAGLVYVETDWSAFSSIITVCSNRLVRFTDNNVLAVLELECCFTSTDTVGLLGTGAQDGHLHFHTAPELCWP